MPRRAGEKVDIPALIKGILNGYPGTSAIFREYLQNSDDAKASSQTFILDERTYGSETLVDPVLRDSQGPALFAVNDGLVEGKDWESIQTIHASSKLMDGNATGKNGLGFRASYHLTENPQILSGRQLLILDPQNNFAANPGGVSLDIIDEGTRYEDQFLAFSSVTDAPLSPFTGTAIRIPLRTKEQARESRIKNTAISTAEILSLLKDFCTNDMETVILFLKHITAIEVKHVRSNGKVVVLGRVNVRKTRISATTTTCMASVQVRNGPDTNRLWHIQHHSISDREITTIISKRLGYDVSDRLRDEKLVPLVDLALPTSGSSITGKLFTLLPLPVVTGFPLHINAVFALTPDRQNLKNRLEVGDQMSRERLLVEWNQVIFDVLVPSAWAELSKIVVGGNYESQFLDELWPSELQDENQYWRNIVPCVLERVVLNNSNVFTTIPVDGMVNIVSLNDKSVVVAGPGIDLDLELLSKLGLRVVQPQPYIFELLLGMESRFSGSIISPQSLYQEIRDMYEESLELPCDNDDDTRPLIDYLASLGSSDLTVSFIRYVPWFNLADGSRVALGYDQRYIIASSDIEFALFGQHCSMLSWDCMSEELRDEVSDPIHFPMLNVSLLRPQDIVLILKNKFKRPASNLDALKDNETWFIDFWTWIVTWPHLGDFFRLEDLYSSLMIIPLKRRKLSPFSAGSFTFGPTNPETTNAWATLGVDPIHQKLKRLASNLVHFIERPRSARYIDRILRMCNVDKQSLLSYDDLWSLQKSLYNGLSSQTILTERGKLAQMHVFMVKTNADDSWVPGPVYNKRLFYVDVDEDFPLPIHPEEDVIYVNILDEGTAALVALLDSDFKAEAFADEDQLLRLAFDYWNLQEANRGSLIVDWIFANTTKLSQDLLSFLSNLPFVTVDGEDNLVPPIGLIGPQSELCRLYDGESGKILAGKFSTTYLPIMRQLDLVHEKLDDVIVAERLEYLTNATEDHRRLQKAKYFIQLCNNFWKPSFSDSFSEMRSMPWMPVEGGIFSAPDNCRDKTRSHDRNDDPYLYDLVLAPVAREVRITSPDFRTALGWSTEPGPDTLLHQFSLTLKLAHGGTRTKRLIVLIDYFCDLYKDAELDEQFLEQLRSLTLGTRWIPASTNSQCVRAEYALLSDDIGLKPPFLRIRDFQSLEFLKIMGCTERPSPDIVIEALKSIDFSSDNQVSASIPLLEELSESRPSFDPYNVLVPGHNKCGVPIPQAYYRDTDHIHTGRIIKNMTQVHKKLSRGLAESLGIQFLSSMVLENLEEEIEDGDDDDDIQMAEDLVTRIQGFLREYDIRFALNEFLANADDASATSFSIMLDVPTPTGKHLLSPAFETFRGVPVLVLHNNAKLSNSDFIGLRKIGLGGKFSRSETHGRHGLGALGFYYFTDVVTVISGRTVLFLDPSRQYLPQQKNAKRTSFKTSLTKIRENYPDQLEPYSSRFKFSEDYEGTIFLLPLKSTISPTPCSQSQLHDLLKESYRALAKSAFFFTRLQEISASECTASGEKKLWSFSATRSRQQAVDSEPNCYLSDLKIQYQYAGKTRVNEQWLIAKQEGIQIPSRHNNVAEHLKLHSTTYVELAISMNASSNDFKSFIFSTLRLPKAMSLPYHLNARFALSSNRQTIVLDPTGSDNHTDPKSAFNLWILVDVVPTLYASILYHLLHGEKKHHLSTEHLWLLHPKDDISSIAQRAFFEELRESELPLVQDVNSTWLPYKEAVFSMEEPPSVNKLLNLAGTPAFVDDEWTKNLAKLTSARTVDPDFVINSLSLRAPESIEDLCEDQDIQCDDVIRVLDYLFEEPDLVDLPLLVLSSGHVIAIPNLAADPVYCSSERGVLELLPSTQFLSDKYSSSTVHRLVSDPEINIHEITEAVLFDLIGLELAKLKPGKQHNKWIHTFWKEHSLLPGPPTCCSLQDSGLRIIRSNRRCLSLSECVPETVVYGSRRKPKPKPLIKILNILGVEVLDLRGNDLVDEYLHERFSDALKNMLRCLDSDTVGLAKWTSLSAKDARYISEWIRKQLVAAIDDREDLADFAVQNITTSLLRRLPIWEAQTSVQGVIRHGATEELKILPQEFDSAKSLLPFQKPGITVASWSSHLTQFVHWLNGRSGKQSISVADIMDIVQLPEHISPENTANMEQMKYFVSSMLPHVPEGYDFPLKVPDHEGYLRRVKDLFDDSVELFETTLNSTIGSSFVHETFNDLRPKLRWIGLQHKIDITSFGVCVDAVEQAAFNLEALDSVDEEDLTGLFSKADTAFREYEDHLANLTKESVHPPRALDSIRFIRVARSRRPATPYDTAPYCQQTNDTFILVSMSQCVRQSLVHIAWTQRFSFEKEPTEMTLRINDSLGVPTTREVVAHLEVLATRISRDHPQDESVLFDLKATYTWLEDHAQDAKKWLLQKATSKLFLNVTEPTTDDWSHQWVSAGEMIRHMNYDVGPFRCVKSFLRPYDKLLEAAGCKSLNATAGLAPSHPDGERLQSSQATFNEMRMSGELTDVVLLPSPDFVFPFEDVGSNEDEDEEDDKEIEFLRVPSANELRAHRAFLASTIPFIRDSARDWKQRGDIKFFGSAIGAKALLDFAYTGDFLTCPAEELSKRQSVCIMNELFGLLTIAHEWHMPDFMKLIESKIIFDYRLIENHPDKYKTMLSEAEDYGATTLCEALINFEKENAYILETLAEE